MPSRKDRLPVVLDTNVLIGFHLSTMTNDRDLLDLSASEKKRFRFAVVTPAELLAELNEERDV